jgi:ligand-binding SRPBCC domain-containing protein
MHFVKETHIDAPPEKVFGFHLLPDAFDRLIPPWEKATVIQRADITEIGSQMIVETKILGPIRSRWIAEHTAYDPPHMFEDVQIKGPFRKWRHRHIVIPDGHGSILRDEVEYEPPLPIFGPLAAPIAIKPRLEKMFAYRHEVTKRWCEQEK